MGKKMKLPFLYKSNSIGSTNSSSWPWPSCHQQPKTLSFRAPNNSIFKTINATFLDTTESTTFPNSSVSASASFSTAFSDDIIEPTDQESIETVMKGVRTSKRLFFEKKGETRSILEDADDNNKTHEKEKEGFMLLTMESKDPYIDFKKSMEEMVEAHGLKDWEDLEKLLTWYLKANDKENHGYIFGAFVDLLVPLSLAQSNTSTTNLSTTTTTTTRTTSSSTSCSCSNLRESPSSPSSFYSSCSSSSSDESSSAPNASSLEGDEDEDEVEEKEKEKEIIHDNGITTCLSSLLEKEDDEITIGFDVVDDYVSS